MALPIGAASPVGTDGKPLKISPGLTATDLARWEPTATAGPVSGPESLPGGARILVVQFKDRVPATFDGLDFDPHRLAVGYLPEDALVIRATDDQAGRLANRSEVAWLGPYQRQWRVSPEVEAERQRLGMTAAQPMDLELALWRGSRADRVLGELARLGANQVRRRTSDAGNTRILFQMASDRLEELSALAEIAWIEPAPVLTRRNAVSSWIVQSNMTSTYPVWDRGLHGEGEIIGHLDGEIDLNSCFFKDEDNGNIPGPGHRKIVAYFDPIDAESHGTHTAGTLAGKRSDGSLTNAGIAYEARLAWGNDLEVEGYLDTASTLKAAFLRAQDAGAWIHSNSWGDDNRTNYTFWCVDIDEYLWENEEALVVFATTNLATLKSPENAKNSISVAAANAPPFQDYVYTGGRGPTNDGRRKPDIVAPGRNVISARASFSCNTVANTGTSMAAPAVAASAALVRQYFREGFYPTGSANEADGFVPSGPLIKAVLLNGTVDMVGHVGFPGTIEGWGRLLLDNSLYFEGDQRRLIAGENRHAQGLTTAAEVEIPFEVDDSGEMLVATLTWYDPPAAHSAAQAWINNLDLQLVSPQGDTYLGNVFSGGFSQTGGTADSVNNVEQVRIEAPEVGEWTLRIVGENIPLGPQGFAWAVSGAVSPLTITPAAPKDTLWID
jgi:subtilisin family serine protease